MKCLVHVWRTLHSDGGSFVLRLTPMASLGKGSALELFPSEGSLSLRLAEIGLTRMRLETTLSNLRDGSTSIWSNYDVADRVFFPQFTQPSAIQNQEEL
jgi:hypothetical protein